jgi:hypothetical protein
LGLALGINWDANFAGLPPIDLPDGRKLETLADCAAFILELPNKQQADERWQRVTAELLKGAELGGPFRFTARLAFSRALHGVSGVGPQPEPRDTGAAWKAKRAGRKPS